jgi:hypothetical protein
MIKKVYVTFHEISKETGWKWDFINNAVSCFKISQFYPNCEKALLAEDVPYLKECVKLKNGSGMRWCYINRLPKSVLDTLVKMTEF